MRLAGKVGKAAKSARPVQKKKLKKKTKEGRSSAKARGNMTSPCGIGIVKADWDKDDRRSRQGRKDPEPRQPESERNDAAAQE